MSRQDAGKADAPAQAARSPVRRFLPLAVLLAGLAAFFALGLHKIVTFEALRTHRVELTAWVGDHRMLAMLGFAAAYVVVVACSLPVAVLLTPLAGFLFGFWWGAALSVCAATLGALAVFLAARSALGGALRGRAGGVVKRLEAGFRRNAFGYLLFLRLVPAFPFWLVNIVPAVLDVPARTFALATLLGILPGAAVYSSVGSGLGAVFDRGGEPDLGIVFQPHVLGPLLALAALSLVPAGYAAWRDRRGTGGRG